jgi:ATP-dependent Lon protease
MHLAFSLLKGLKLLQKARKNGLALEKRTSSPKPISLKRAIRKLGDDPSFEEDEDEITELEEKIKSCNMPPEAEKAAMKELRRLKRMPQQMPEHAMIR